MNPQKLEKSIELTFSDGSNLKVVGDHRIYDVDKGLFVSSLKCEVGLKTFNSSGEVITLVDKNIIEEENYAYNVITYNHINMFANGILTSQGSNNIYDIKDMKFVKNDRDKFSEEDLSDIDSKYVEGLRLKEWNTLDKGSKEETLKDMHEYVNKLNSKRK